MHSFRKLNVGALFWALIVAGGYLLSIEQARTMLGIDELRQLLAMPFTSVQLVLSAAIAFLALCSIWQINLLWGVVAVVLVKLSLWLLALSYMGGAGVSVFQLCFRTALVAGISFMFIRMDRKKKAHSIDEARAKEFSYDD
jgi:hypothetical protein